MPEIIKVYGLEELARKLKALPARMTRNALRSGVNAGARLVRDTYKMSVNSRTGTLRRSIVTKFIRERSNDQQAMYYVTARKGKKLQRLGKRNADAYYAGWVEFGHKIVPRGGKGTFRARRAAATGTVEGKRWLTRAFESKKLSALDAIKIRIGQNLAKMAEFK